ncbi:MAG: adenylate/guanylate cyclase domain-containing protein [Deltaproteobacteria bacterium]|nr:adenylate/guanylate cyclase domain-containing protein [Deltaproteobacteria bacterium]
MRRPPAAPAVLGLGRPATIVLAWLALTAGGAALDLAGVTGGYERAASDLWHRLSGLRRTPQHVAIVGIDEASLAEKPDEPLVFWSPHYARALDALGKVGAKVVGVDLLLTVSPEAWLARAGLAPGDVRNFDQPFRKVLGEGRTVLTAFATGTERDAELLLPNRDYWLSLPGLLDDVALANLEYDDDGVLRSFRILSDRPDSPRRFLGALLAARAAGQDLDAPTWHLGGRDLQAQGARHQVAFAGPPGTVPVVPISRLLAANAERDPQVRALAGKTVLFAATYHAAQDVHPTPYAPLMMHGAEIHAQIAESLLTGRRFDVAPLWLHAALLALVAVAGALLISGRPGVGRGAVVTSVGLLSTAGLAFGLWQLDIAVPIAGMQAVLVSGFVAGLGLGLRGSERRREELKRMFGRYVSDEVVAHLLGSGHAPDLGGEAGQVSVLFCDIRNFTTISERLRPHEVVDMLNAWFSLAAEPILAQGGTIDKYIGDAIMAVFGAPAPQPDHARRALKAAAEMARRAEKFRGWMEERFAGRDLPAFGIGIGIHSGEAVSGNIGSPRRMEFTTIGDTVNAASRLEGLTKGMGVAVAISSATADAAGNGLRLGPPQQTQVKGRQEAMQVMAFEGFDDETGGRA